MADEITDIEKWKTNYSFLQELSTLYDIFDRDVKNDPKDSTYNLLCNQYIGLTSENVTIHKNFCKKLIRNLGHYSDNPESHNFTGERCNILNYWVYNSMKKHGIPERIIIDVFEHYSEMLNRSINNISGCSYHSYDKIYEDPMIAIMLNIFKTYVGDVKNALMNKDASKHMRALKFVCDCVKIYKNKMFNFCSYENPNDPKHQKTCGEFKSFKVTYTSFLFGQSGLVKDISSLDDIDKEYSNMCGQFERTTISAIAPVVSPSGDGNEDTVDETSSPMAVDVETRNNPISSTVSTSLGAVAGASSLLALLYKFSPGRNWIRSGIGGGRRRINSNLYEDGPNEFLLEGFEGRDMSSYNTRYNVGYGSV
ncbi:Plasmodium vivax Vir protein, putative [Plasmodium vivax]|uniref:Vir protein, putative n=1 Tax=Plasmodium vivax TaxID=5855 RepID=A0A1G4EGK1_PLAVI|nr:Plasmodium vivax Vir protein, putative [Plasmodium vivax]